MSSKTILIADDDINILKAMKIRLESNGYRVIATQDAYQAFEQAVKANPDLFILDINMPAGNGFSVQERIQKIPQLIGTPVIYISGADPDQVDSIVQSLGAFALLHKPIEASVFLSTVESALGVSDQSATPV